MIAHVAEAGEDRGRVVLAMTGVSSGSDTAIDAAIRIAEAFQSEIESLYIEDRRIFQLGAYPFVREVGRNGLAAGPLSTESVERESGFAAAAAQRRVRDRATKSEVRLRLTTVRNEPVAALAAACAERGPWNVVVLGEPLRPGAGALLREVFETVHGTTGVVAVGPRANRTSGPVILAVEDIDRLSPMLGAAGRLGAAGQWATRVLLLADDRERLSVMEDQTRLALGDKPGFKIEIAGLTRTDAGSVAEHLRRMQGGFLVAQYGGLVVPAATELGPLLSVLECPMLLVR